MSSSFGKTRKLGGYHCRGYHKDKNEIQNFDSFFFRFSLSFSGKDWTVDSQLGLNFFHTNIGTPFRVGRLIEFENHHQLKPKYFLYEFKSNEEI